MRTRALRGRHSHPPSRYAGHTLFELLLALSLLALIGAVAAPNLAPLDASRLDVASDEVANALRYARNEAIRRGSQADSAATRMIAFDASTTTHHVRVSDWSGFTRVGPWPHPLDHDAYDVDLYNGLATAGVTISAVSFVNSGGVAVGAICGFTQDGAPVQFQLSGGTGSFWPLSSGMVQVSYAGHSRQVSIDANGRVTVGSLL